MAQSRFHDPRLDQLNNHVDTWLFDSPYWNLMHMWINLAIWQPISNKMFYGLLRLIMLAISEIHMYTHSYVHTKLYVYIQMYIWNSIHTYEFCMYIWIFMCSYIWNVHVSFICTSEMYTWVSYGHMANLCDLMV